jgi:hypothetical protein
MLDRLEAVRGDPGFDTEFSDKVYDYELFDDPPPVGPEQDVGSISYTNGQTSRLMVPPAVGPTYQVSINNQQQVNGLHIPSHRPIYSYQTLESIPATPKRRNTMFAQYMEIVRNRYYGSHHPRTPNYYIKETLIALATFGYGNEVVDADPESLEVFEQFQEILRKVLPPSLGFLRLSVRLPELILVTTSGNFSLDAASGGVASLVDMAWQIFTYPEGDGEFVVTLDEPENHLHPELQRTVLRGFLDAFPRVQFICATHNPFIVGSVPASNVFVLRYDELRRVYSELLVTIDRSGSSNEILRDVLGIDSASPLWVEDRLNQVEKEFRDKELSRASLEELRERMKELGLERFVPAILANIAEKRLSQ